MLPSGETPFDTSVVDIPLGDRVTLRPAPVAPLAPSEARPPRRGKMILLGLLGAALAAGILAIFARPRRRFF
jgi:hypothetical protein